MYAALKTQIRKDRLAKRKKLVTKSVQIKIKNCKMYVHHRMQAEVSNPR